MAEIKPPERVTLPKTVGLCTGEHEGEFYMPDAKSGDTCPQCPQKLAVYVPREQVDELVRAATEALPHVRRPARLRAALKPFPDPEPEGEAG